VSRRDFHRIEEVSDSGAEDWSYDLPQDYASWLGECVSAVSSDRRVTVRRVDGMIESPVLALRRLKGHRCS